MKTNLIPNTQCFANDSIKYYPSDFQVIENINGEELIKSGGKLLFREFSVHPEFLNLVKIPLDIFTTIRDPFPKFHKPTMDKLREDYCKELASDLNGWILKRYPNIPTHSRTARFVRVDEYGKSHDHVHTHLLWHINRKAPKGITTEILDYLDALEPHTFRGVKCFDNQMIHDKLGVVSYLCKIEKGREDKKFGWSPFFWKIYSRKVRQGIWS